MAAQAPGPRRGHLARRHPLRIASVWVPRLRPTAAVAAMHGETRRQGTVFPPLPPARAATTRGATHPAQAAPRRTPTTPRPLAQASARPPPAPSTPRPRERIPRRRLAPSTHPLPAVAGRAAGEPTPRRRRLPSVPRLQPPAVPTLARPRRRRTAARPRLRPPVDRGTRMMTEGFFLTEEEGWHELASAAFWGGRFNIMPMACVVGDRDMYSKLGRMHPPGSQKEF